MNIKELQKKALERRIDLLQMIYEAKTGHIGGSLSSVDILVTLYYEIMKIDPLNPKWAERDRFILSKGHSVEGYYAILADLGFFPKGELKTFSQYQSRLIGHPTVKVPGIEMNTGALGHGIAAAVGMALAGKMDHQGYKVYVLMGDGEQAEGSVWEAAMAAGHYQLDNLVGIIDRNRLQISGNTEKVMTLECLVKKWESFNWEVIEVDGNDIGELRAAFKKVPAVTAKPHLVMANTIKGKGISFMENVAQWHHGTLSPEQFETALQELRFQLEEVVQP
ncbi:MAG: transketolase [Bacillota bacterium]|jgi:transketolase